MLAVLGIAIAAYGRSIPVFSADRETVEQALLAWCPDGFNVDRAAGERYLALFTRHYAWVVLLAIYLLTSTRAALLSPKQGDAADDCR
ncbi:MAG TPA: hypothetical protein VF079_00455 [Sphingomicrobium sp.]